ncbi:hypothetical protein SAMN05216388_101169 [Halorientalis persicus]|jgi:uncharacterized Tic20 family protein|uniref:TrbL/VirB6 plasmid conjugal transfer protein n=1 Tax=Halorientalis persicus TaxID=1367881 RepID=A0A1H8NWC4_9EURY|nr:hypothetical protein [Halorientalis persicus]SEO33832.1 hypothetical protein SAMN05216388_101169 [Halorientalis persicus]
MKRHILLALVLCTMLAGPASAATGALSDSASADRTATPQTVGSDLTLQTDDSTQNGTNSTQDGTDGTQNGTNGDSGDGDLTEEDVRDAVLGAIFGSNSDSGSGGGSGSDSGGDSGPDSGPFRSIAQDAIEGAILSLLDGLGDDASAVAQDFQEKGIIFRVPAPGAMDQPATWVQPDTWTGDHAEEWTQTYKYFWVIGFLGFAGLLPALMLAMGKGNRSPDRGTLQRFVRGFLLIVAGWVVVAFLYHSADAVTQLIAPAPLGGDGPGGAPGYMDVLETSKNSNLAVLGPFLSGTKGTLLMTSFGVLYIQFVLTFVCAALWPAMWVLNAYRSTMARSAGKIGLTFMGALLIMKIMQAVIFRFLVGLDLTGTTGELAATVGIAVAFVLLPYTVLAKMIPRTLLIFGLHELREKGREDRRYQERLGNVRRKFNQSLRRSPDGGVERVGPANRGSKGLPNRRAGQLESGRADGGRGLPRGSEGRPDRRADGGDTEDRR